MNYFFQIPILIFFSTSILGTPQCLHFNSISIQNQSIEDINTEHIVLQMSGRILDKSSVSELKNVSINKLCERIFFTQKNGNPLPTWTPVCTYKRFESWVKIPVQSELQLRLSYCKNVQNTHPSDIFTHSINSKNFNASKWKFHHPSNKIYSDNHNVIVDTRKKEPLEGTGTVHRELDIDQLTLQKPLVIDYRFRNLQDLPKHQQALAFGVVTSDIFKRLTWINHPLLSNSSRFAIVKQFKFEGNISHHIEWLNFLEIQKDYHVKMVLNFLKKKVDYYIFDDHYTLLSQYTSEDFLHKDFNLSDISKLSIQLGDHCGDQGYASYSFINLWNDFQDKVNVEVSSNPIFYFQKSNYHRDTLLRFEELKLGFQNLQSKFKFYTSKLKHNLFD